MITTFIKAEREAWDHLFIFSINEQVFTGNQNAYEMKKNTFFPPLVGRFIRLHPLQWYNKATVRMELYGCELDGKMLLSMLMDFKHFISAFIYCRTWSPENGHTIF